MWGLVLLLYGMITALVVLAFKQPTTYNICWALAGTGLAAFMAPVFPMLRDITQGFMREYARPTPKP
jgi:hypothetical protein